jgi:peptide/nickel transport system permease protein
MFPAGILVAIILAVNFVGDGLRDAFDPNAAGAGARTKRKAAAAENDELPGETVVEIAQ